MGQVNGKAGKTGAMRWKGRGVALLACFSLGACSLFGAHPIRASVNLRPTQGNTARGVVALAERGEGIQVTYNVVGLAPNTQHTFVIHVGGDCRGLEAHDAGPRYHPVDLPHTTGVDAGPALGSDRSAGQLTQIWADANGVAMGFFVLPGMTLDGVRSVVGRTMIIHDGADEWGDDQLADAPDAAVDDAGAALACGVIAR